MTKNKKINFKHVIIYTVYFICLLFFILGILSLIFKFVFKLPLFFSLGCFVVFFGFAILFIIIIYNALNGRWL